MCAIARFKPLYYLQECKAYYLLVSTNPLARFNLRFIEDPHHIEIQVIADSFGNVAAFPERCVRVDMAVTAVAFYSAFPLFFFIVV